MTEAIQLGIERTSALSGLHVVFDWRRFDEGGLDDLRTFLEDNPRITLVIIDVWERVRPAESNRHGAKRLYSMDYASLAKLKTMCQEFDGLAALVLHHTSKRELEEFTDPLDLVSGTTGLAAAVDNVLLLIKQRGQLKLIGRGREVEAFEIPVELDIAGGRGLGGR